MGSLTRLGRKVELVVFVGLRDERNGGLSGSLELSLYYSVVLLLQKQDR